jgi:hypothetical protein
MPPTRPAVIPSVSWTLQFPRKTRVVELHPNGILYLLCPQALDRVPKFETDPKLRDERSRQGAKTHGNYRHYSLLKTTHVESTTPISHQVTPQRS